MSAATNSANRLPKDEFEESRLPERVGTTYQAMYVHGMHFRVRSTEEEKITCDNGVASAVWRCNRGRTGNRAGRLESAEYVG
jgi:hypothetical protein